MSLTASQKLAIRKHLEVPPTDPTIDPFIGTLEDGAEKEAELVAALTECDTKLSNKKAVQDNADELTEGGGAKFNYDRALAIKERAYREAVCNLSRIIQWPAPWEGNRGGFLSL